MIRETKLKPLLLVSFFVAVLLLVPTAHCQEKKNLRIVFVSLSWNNQLPIRAAITKGFFKDQGLTLEPIFVRGGPVAISALVSGNVDFASVGGAQAPIRSNARGLDLHIIASLSNYTNYTLLGSKNVKNVEDLRGRVIGITGAGAFSEFAIRIYLKRNNIDPDKDVTLRAIGGSALRVIALEKGLIAAAPFSAEDTVKAVILGMQFVKHNKQDAIKAGYLGGLKGDPDIVNRSYDLFSPGYASDLSVAQDGIQIMLDEDIRAGLVDRSFTLDRVIDDRILIQAQEELRKEGRLKP
jgi:ABC-type nitrate/sulfonate/bicarbonate transport system substrate-binding protein